MILSAGEVPWECPLGSSLMTVVSFNLGETSLSSHVDCPAHLSGSWLHYPARQAGIKEPMLLKWVIVAGLPCMMLLRGRERGWLQVTSHTSSPAQSPGKVNHPSHVAARSPWVMPCRLLCNGSCFFDTYRLKVTPQVLTVSYRRFLWEITSVGRAVHSSQLPYGRTKLASFRNQRNTTDFTSPEVLR